MRSKFINTKEIMTGTRTSKFVQARQFISEEEYKIKISSIVDILNTVFEQFNSIDNNLNKDFTQFKECEEEINSRINEMIQYIDSVVSDETDVEKIKRVVQNYTDEFISKFQNRMASIVDQEYLNILLYQFVYKTVTNYYTDCRLDEKNLQHNFTKVICNGTGNYLALRDDGTIWGSGPNANGELGFGNTNPTELGQFLQIGEWYNITDIRVAEDGFIITGSDGKEYQSGKIYDLKSNLPVLRKDIVGIPHNSENANDEIFKLAPGTLDSFVTPEDVISNYKRETNEDYEYLEKDMSKSVNIEFETIQKTGGVSGFLSRRMKLKNSLVAPVSLDYKNDVNETSNKLVQKDSANITKVTDGIKTGSNAVRINIDESLTGLAEINANQNISVDDEFKELKVTGTASGTATKQVPFDIRRINMDYEKFTSCTVSVARPYYELYISDETVTVFKLPKPENNDNIPITNKIIQFQIKPHQKSEYIDYGSLVIYDKKKTHRVLTKNDIISTDNKNGDLYTVNVDLPLDTTDVYVASFGFVVKYAYYNISGPAATLTTSFIHDHTANDSLNDTKFHLDYSPKVNIDFDDNGNKIFKSAEPKADMSKYKYFSTLKYEGQFDSIRLKTLGKGIGLIFVNGELRQIIHNNHSDSIQDYFIDGSQGLVKFTGSSNRLDMLFFNNFENGIYYDTTITELELYNSDKVKYQNEEFGELFKTDTNGDAKIVVENMEATSLSMNDNVPLMIYNPDTTYDYARNQGHVRKATLVCPNTFVKNTAYTLKFKLKNKRSLTLPFPDGVCLVCAGGYDYTSYAYAKGLPSDGNYNNYNKGWGEITMHFTPTSNTQKITLYAYSGSVIKDLYIPEFDYYFKFSDFDQNYDSYSEPPKPATNDGTYITYGHGKCISFYKYKGNIVALWPNDISDGSRVTAIKTYETIDSDTILSKFSNTVTSRDIRVPTGYNFSPTLSNTRQPLVVFHKKSDVYNKFTITKFTASKIDLRAIVFVKYKTGNFGGRFNFQGILKSFSGSTFYFNDSKVSEQDIVFPHGDPAILLVIPIFDNESDTYSIDVDVGTTVSNPGAGKGVCFSATDYKSFDVLADLSKTFIPIGPLYGNMVAPGQNISEANRYIRYKSTPNGYSVVDNIPRVYGSLDNGNNFHAFYIPGDWTNHTFYFFIELQRRQSDNYINSFRLVLLSNDNGAKSISILKETNNSSKLTKRIYYKITPDSKVLNSKSDLLFMMVTNASLVDDGTAQIIVSFPVKNLIPDAYFYAEKEKATENAVVTQSELVATPPSGIMPASSTCEFLAHNRSLVTSIIPHFYGIELLDTTYTKIKFGLSNSSKGFTHKFIATGSSTTYGLCNKIAYYTDDTFVNTDKQIFFINMAKLFSAHTTTPLDINVGVITDFILQKADGTQLHIDMDNFDSYSSVVKKITATEIGSNLIKFAPNTLRVFKIDNSQGLKYNILKSYVSPGKSSYGILLGTNTKNQNGNITYEFFSEYKNFNVSTSYNREAIMVAFPTGTGPTSTYAPSNLTLELTKYNQNSMTVKLPANLTIKKPSLNFKHEVIVGMNLEDVTDLEFIPVTGTKVFLDDNEETLTANTLKQYDFRTLSGRSIMFVKNIVNELTSAGSVTYIAKNVLKNLTGEIVIEMPKSVYTDINLFLKNTYNTSTTYANKNMSILYSVNSDLFKREKILNSAVLQPNFKFSKPEDHLMIFKDENKLKVGPLYTLDIEGESDYTINEGYAGTEYIPDPGDRNSEKYLIAFNTLNNLSDNMKEKNIVEDKNEIVQQVKIFKRDETSTSFKMRVTYDYTWLRNILNTDTYISMEDIQGPLYGIAYGASKRTLSRNLTFMPIN